MLVDFLATPETFGICSGGGVSAAALFPLAILSEPVKCQKLRYFESGSNNIQVFLLKASLE